MFWKWVLWKSQEPPDVVEKVGVVQEAGLCKDDGRDDHGQLHRSVLRHHLHRLRHRLLHLLLHGLHHHRGELVLHQLIAVRLSSFQLGILGWVIPRDELIWY